MSVKTFKKFIEELREQGISIEKLSLSQVSESMKLYKILENEKPPKINLGGLR